MICIARAFDDQFQLLWCIQISTEDKSKQSYSGYRRCCRYQVHPEPFTSVAALS